MREAGIGIAQNENLQEMSAVPPPPNHKPQSVAQVLPQRGRPEAVPSRYFPGRSGGPMTRHLFRNFGLLRRYQQPEQRSIRGSSPGGTKQRSPARKRWKNVDRTGESPVRATHAHVAAIATAYPHAHVISNQVRNRPESLARALTWSLLHRCRSRLQPRHHPWPDRALAADSDRQMSALRCSQGEAFRRSTASFRPVIPTERSRARALLGAR